MTKTKATALKQLRNAANNFQAVEEDHYEDTAKGTLHTRRILRATRETLLRLSSYQEFGRPYASLTSSLLRDLADKIEADERRREESPSPLDKLRDSI
jgi:hypothetical protein